jgi:hypothetical protein
MRASMQRHVTAWQAAVMFAVLTGILTWPQVRHPLSVPDHFDPYFSMWRIGWIAHQLPRDPVHLFDANIFYPLRHALAFSDAVLLEGTAAAPFLWLGVPLVVVYNAEILGSFVLCGLGVFLLVRELTASSAAALVAGTIFAFAPYRFDHYIHLELLWGQWMPLALWSLHRTLRSASIRDGVWTGVFAALQGLSCVYLAVFLATVLIVLAPLLLLLVAPPPLRRRAAVALCAGTLIAGAALVTYVLPYQAARDVVGERGDAQTMRAYAAGPRHYLAAMPGSLVYGNITGRLGVHEKRLFPGAMAILLLAVGLWPPLDRTRVAYLIALALALDLSFGYRGLLIGPLQEHLAVFRGLRVMARMGGVVLLLVAVLAGYGATRLLSRVAATPARQGWCAATLIGIAAIEYAMWPMDLHRVPTTPSAVYRWLRDQPAGVVAEFPMPVREPADLTRYEPLFIFESTFHWHPLVNGYSGFWPSEYILLVRRVRDFPSDASIEALRQRGVRYVILHERLYGTEQYAIVAKALAARTDVRAEASLQDGSFEDRAFRLLPASP